MLNPIPLSRLARRGVLRISGKDSTSFLHAMSTNNFNAPKHDGTLPTYAAFLSNKGRVLFDFIAHPQLSSGRGLEGYLAEMDRDKVPLAVEHLLQYKMRTKVDIEDVSEQYTILVDQSSAVPSFALDPRPPLANCTLRRGIVPSLSAEAAAPPGDAAYNELLFSQGIAEGEIAFDMGKSLPFEGNLDLLGGVSFDKGCYVGQELTHRTHVMLVTRKRLMPFTVIGIPPLAFPRGEQVVCRSGSNAGRILGWQGHHGVALMRLERLTPKVRNDMYLYGTGGYDGTLNAYIPAWWPTDYVFERFSSLYQKETSTAS